MELCTLSPVRAGESSHIVSLWGDMHGFSVRERLSVNPSWPWERFSLSHATAAKCSEVQLSVKAKNGKTWIGMFPAFPPTLENQEEEGTRVCYLSEFLIKSVNSAIGSLVAVSSP